MTPADEIHSLLGSLTVDASNVRDLGDGTKPLRQEACSKIAERMRVNLRDLQALVEPGWRDWPGRAVSATWWFVGEFRSHIQSPAIRCDAPRRVDIDMNGTVTAVPFYNIPLSNFDGKWLPLRVPEAPR